MWKHSCKHSPGRGSMHGTHKHDRYMEKHNVCCTENYVNNRELVNTKTQKQLRAALLLKEVTSRSFRVNFLFLFLFFAFSKVTATQVDGNKREHCVME